MQLLVGVHCVLLRNVETDCPLEALLRAGPPNPVELLALIDLGGNTLLRRRLSVWPVLEQAGHRADSQSCDAKTGG